MHPYFTLYPPLPYPYSSRNSSLTSQSQSSSSIIVLNNLLHHEQQSLQADTRKKSSLTDAQDDGVASDEAVGPPLRNITDLLDTLLLGYDQHLRPDLGGEFDEFSAHPALQLFVVL